MKQTLKTYGRKLVMFLIGTTIAIGLLFAAAVPSQRAEADANARLLEAQQDAANAALATACVLSLPVTEMGRSQQLVHYCFTQNGLTPPELP